MLIGRTWLRSSVFNITATTKIYTLSLHDALPIYGRDLDSCGECRRNPFQYYSRAAAERGLPRPASHYLDHHEQDRKSTRLNSSHVSISYAVFCLKKKI